MPRTRELDLLSRAVQEAGALLAVALQVLLAI